MICMKTIGEKVKEFRESKGWNAARMAKEVGTYRQSIENLEAKGDRKPRYIVDLARVTTATATVTLPSLGVTATATNQASPELTEQYRSIMAMLATLPDDPVIRYQVLGQLAEIVARARGSPSSHQEPPAYQSQAATRIG